MIDDGGYRRHGLWALVQRVEVADREIPHYWLEEKSASGADRRLGRKNRLRPAVRSFVSELAERKAA